VWYEALRQVIGPEISLDFENAIQIAVHKKIRIKQQASPLGAPVEWIMARAFLGARLKRDSEA
jgi:hypothetical protein